jgi:hypothetical protein
MRQAERVDKAIRNFEDALKLTLNQHVSTAGKSEKLSHDSHSMNKDCLFINRRQYFTETPRNLTWKIIAQDFFWRLATKEALSHCGLPKHKTQLLLSDENIGFLQMCELLRLKGHVFESLLGGENVISCRTGR